MSSSSPLAHSNVVDDSIETREFAIEPDFIADSFKGHKYTMNALSVLKKQPFKAMSNLPTRMYPRIVRAFYSSLEEIEDDEGKPAFTVVIDELAYEFSYKDIAEALRIPNYRYKKYKVATLAMRNALNARAPVDDDGSQVRVSYMHEDMWLIDMFLYYVICPNGHTHERPQYLQPFWHSVLMGKGIDIPQLMMVMVDRVKKGGKKAKLLYPRCITALLEYLGHEFEPDEDRMSGLWKLDYEKVAQKFTRLAQVSGLEQPKHSKKEVGRVSDRPESQPTEPSRARLREKGKKAAQEEQEEEEEENVNVEPDAPFTMSRAQYEAMIAHQQQVAAYHQQASAYQEQANEWRTNYGARIVQMGERQAMYQEEAEDWRQGCQERFDLLEETQDRMESRQEEMYSLQRLYISDAVGNERANQFFTEAQTEVQAADLGRHNRRRRTRNRGGDNMPLD